MRPSTLVYAFCTRFTHKDQKSDAVSTSFLEICHQKHTKQVSTLVHQFRLAHWSPQTTFSGVCNVNKLLSPSCVSRLLYRVARDVGDPLCPVFHMCITKLHFDVEATCVTWLTYFCCCFLAVARLRFCIDNNKYNIIYNICKINFIFVEIKWNQILNILIVIGISYNLLADKMLTNKLINSIKTYQSHKLNFKFNFNLISHIS